MYKNTLTMLIINIVVILFLFTIVSCRNKSDDKSNKQDYVIDNTEEKNLSNAFIMPYYLDPLTDSEPEILEELQDIDKNLEDFMKSTDFNPQEELKRYLEQKMEYDKSNIFNSVP